MTSKKKKMNNESNWTKTVVDAKLEITGDEQA